LDGDLKKEKMHIRTILKKAHHVRLDHLNYVYGKLGGARIVRPTRVYLIFSETGYRERLLFHSFEGMYKQEFLF